MERIIFFGTPAELSFKSPPANVIALVIADRASLFEVRFFHSDLI